MKDRPLVLNRELTLKPDDQWLVIAAARVRPQGAVPKIDVRIDGQPAAEFEVPDLRGNVDETPPLVVSLAPYQHKTTEASPTIQIEIRQLPGAADAAPIRWRSIYTTSRLPTVCELYEDQPQLAAESAKFGVAFIRIGLSACDIGVSWALPRLVGASRAHELMLTGRVFDSAEAERIGLVSKPIEFSREHLDRGVGVGRTRVPDRSLPHNGLLTVAQLRFEYRNIQVTCR